MALVSGGLLGARSKAKSLTYHKAIARVLGGSERRQGKKHESKHGEASHDEREGRERGREHTHADERRAKNDKQQRSSSGAPHRERGQRPQGRWTAACSVPGYDRVSRSLSLSISVARHRLPLGFSATECVAVSGRSRSEVVRRKRTSERDRAMQLCVALPTSTNDDSGTLCSTAQLALTAVRVACSCAQLLAHFALSVVCRSLPTGACTVFPAPYALRSR